MNLKPIETLYKGYRFRSRLEARWAVFFDALEVEWKYEDQGYRLPNGEPYLPDFWLPQHSIFVEIKGKDSSPEEDNRCELLAKQTGHAVLLFVGLPEERVYPFAPKQYRVVLAVEAARSARFEHGESGAPLDPRDGILGAGWRGVEWDLVRAMLHNRFYVDEILERVGPDRFWDPMMRVIYEAIINNPGAPITAVLEGAALDAAGQILEAGSPDDPSQSVRNALAVLEARPL